MHGSPQRLFDLSLDLLATAGSDGFFKDLNPAWERALGHSLGELTARPFLDFVHPEDRQATLAAVASLAHGGEAAGFENRYRCKDGTYKWPWPPPEIRSSTRPRAT